MNKWKELREWDDLPAHVARKMDELEMDQHSGEKFKGERPEPEGFLFTGRPTFDQKAWEEILKNLQGLA